MRHSVRYTILFATALCAVCSILVSATAVALRERQQENKLLDQRRNVLRAVGLLAVGERLPREEIERRFSENFEVRAVHLESGRYADEVDPRVYDQRRARSDPQSSRAAPENPAKVRRLPDVALVYLQTRDARVEAIVLPVEGMGLWSTLYGYLALSGDARTIRGIAFYEHGETPGLGGEVDNPRWRARWPGRLAFDESWEPRIAVAKGRVGPPEQDPYRVDGLSGSTLTSNGVTNLVQFWLGDHGFGSYLERYRREGEI
ncbi:MAG: Na(+)-translocating NADH-quinone reductase subunit C [Deltaproteobacteria bacterium]|nr:MAG: Na(+)-translocating NADH-quinone reductase subunit C [Deltaproteobacteria bacterium]